IVRKESIIYSDPPTQRNTIQLLMRDYLIFSQVSISQPSILGSSKRVRFNCIWDTGATHTAISLKVAAACDIKQTGFSQVQTMNGKLIPSSTALINIYLSDSIIIKDFNVVIVKMLDSNIDVLIGMDIISKGRLLYSKDLIHFTLLSHKAL
ncbi:retroviral-like aspartic protease family protein, partial [candidate division KSB1 bacterium]